ncbi:MAG: hypothetical protein DDG60_00560 [Anaerolineae bacterium]|nr:MAG: hypothetical protein DDG60_00560 [Anaerolineae bacterium]
MQTVRRLYFFGVAFISIEVVLWGLIQLLRVTVSTGLLLPRPEILAQALALILVGVPLFLLHWGWAQRVARTDAAEHAATLRAVFLYAILLATLVPVVQNGLALINRSLVLLAGLEPYRALLGGNQSWSDNLIAIFFNLTLAAYFYRVTQLDLVTLLHVENYHDVRRLYRYLWVLYGLLMLVFGVQQVIRALFHLPVTIETEMGSEKLLNGLALILVGAPIWVLAWQTVQRACTEPHETNSYLRLGILYLLALGGVVTVLSTIGIVLDVFLRLSLGESLLLSEILSQVGGPFSVGIPLGVVWAYYGNVLTRQIASYPSVAWRATLKRFYFYFLAIIGLITTFIGLALLFSFLIEIFTSQIAIFTSVMLKRLSAALSTLMVGLPLWLFTWPPMQREALASDENGDNARRSLIRRTYLYLVIFSAVIGGMISAIVLFYNLLYALLGSVETSFLRDVLHAIEFLLLFVIFLAYHWLALRSDSGQKADTLTAKQMQFPVLIFEQSGSEIAGLIQEAIRVSAPSIPVAAIAIEQGIPEDAEAARAVILPSTLAFNPPEALRVWLKDYTGHKIIVPIETPGWYWPGGFPRNGILTAAQITRQLAEGQPIRTSTGNSILQIVAYVFAILFAIQVLFMLLALGISLLSFG